MENKQRIDFIDAHKVIRSIDSLNKQKIEFVQFMTNLPSLQLAEIFSESQFGMFFSLLGDEKEIVREQIGIEISEEESLMIFKMFMNKRPRIFNKDLACWNRIISKLVGFYQTHSVKVNDKMYYSIVLGKFFTDKVEMQKEYGAYR